MTTYTAKTADLNAIIASTYANIYTEAGAKEASKVRKLAAKMETGFETALLAMVVKKVNYGTIKMDGWWFPVVAGEVIAFKYQFSSAAMAHTVSMAGNVALKY